MAHHKCTKVEKPVKDRPDFDKDNPNNCGACGNSLDSYGNCTTLGCGR